MFTKFNDTSIITKFIKNLVNTTYLPNVPIWVPGKPLIKGYTYITNGHIIKALNTIVNTTDLKITDSYYLKVISDYIPTKFYPGINQTYTANSVSYDSDLHYYLGLYLRYYRDLTGINLMHYYNCVSGEYSNNVDLTDSGVVHIDDYTDTGYKILKVNINFDETYSVYVDCASSFYIGASYEYKNNISNSINFTQKLNYSNFVTPYIFKPIIRPDFERNLTDKNLYMYIKVPKSISSNIVVLEGDYSKSHLLYSNNIVRPNRVFYGNTTLLSQNEIDRYFNTIPKLITHYTTSLNAFDNKLIEYLVDNTINSADPISKNIESVQNYISSRTNLLENHSIYKIPYTKGIWDTNLRMYLYDLALTNPRTPLITNVDGYVDKDLETIVTRGQDV